MGGKIVANNETKDHRKLWDKENNEEGNISISILI